MINNSPTIPKTCIYAKAGQPHGGQTKTVSSKQRGKHVAINRTVVKAVRARGRGRNQTSGDLTSKALFYQQTSKTPIETIDNKPEFSDPTDNFPTMTKPRTKKKVIKHFPITPTTLD